MHARHSVHLALVAAAAALAGTALAQGAKAPLQAPSWNQTVTKEAEVAGQEFDAKQMEIIQRVTAYFNQMGDMKGNFHQVTADNKRLRGKFYIKRPGQFRFEYNLPSKQIIVSDGKYLIIEDHDLKTDTRWGLDQTPFRVLLRKDVDLVRDARILEVGETDDRIVLALQDKSPDTPGRIKLFLLKKPAVELKEWITTDAQGMDTRVELQDFGKAENLDPKLFVPSSVTLQKFQQ
ncbi:MAG: outer membrane lipoprotein carrier protein LolA [Hyphomonadaceae bacterium]|jgi:outer membrane lipoprotein-sorting protein|nr:outer membrane lipoprotein carrier protein LolA [Hyphomonadaceae bacterium]